MPNQRWSQLSCWQYIPAMIQWLAQGCPYLADCYQSCKPVEVQGMVKQLENASSHIFGKCKSVLLTLLTVTLMRPFLKMNPLAMYSYSSLEIHFMVDKFSFFPGLELVCTCIPAQWGTRQHCCCKQCHNSFSPLCSFDSSQAAPHIWLFHIRSGKISRF